MSVNHYSSDQLPQTQYWRSSQYSLMDQSSSKTSSSHDHQTLISSSSVFWANASAGHEEEAVADDGGDQLNSTYREFGRRRAEEEMTKEPLFEKPLTPSDVGKLNRLVIPKQYAEKYFPIKSGGDSGEKGLLLDFEDEVLAGKLWRFRYSYWNSSQSYVLTKGWSRFVKEKRLDAGDTVVFTRHRGDVGRFFIGWRRRRSISGGGGVQQESGVGDQPPSGGGGGWMRRVFYGGQRQHGGSSSLPYQPADCRHAGPVMEKQTKAANGGNSKKLRLFGVNLEYWEAGSDHHHH